MNEKTISVSTKRLTKTAVKKALEKFLENDPTALENALQALEEVRPGKKQNIAINPDEIFTGEEVDKVLDFCNSSNPGNKFNTDPDKYKKLALIIWTLYYTGLRISELTGIRLSKIKVNDIATIHILGKGRRERKIFLPSGKVEEIKNLFQSKKFLFENRTGNKYDERNLRRELEKVFYNVIPGKNFHPHILRHSFATQKLKEGKSIKAISEYLGHSSTAVTEDLYIHDILSYGDLF